MPHIAHNEIRRKCLGISLMRAFMLMIPWATSIGWMDNARATETVAPLENVENKANICADHPQSAPHLIFDTTLGNIEIKLLEDAAPSAIRRFAEIVRGPTFNEAIFGPNRVGYYEGLAFEYTKPKAEIRLTERQPDDLIKIPAQIDADALGLRDKKITDIDEAMDVMQFELLKKYRDTKTSGGRTQQLDDWLAKWFKDNDASFLLGVSSKEIKQSMGYVYQTGLKSRPMTPGAVALKPISPNLAGMTLSILLTDMPKRTGEWMVIGEVVKGMDVVEQISIQPLREPSHIRSRTYVPFSPVVVRSAQVECR